MPRVTVNGKSLYYTGLSKEASSAPPLIFLYGVGGDHRLWLPVARALKGFHRYIPDLAGHGRTGGPAPDAIAGYAADISGLMDALGLPEAILVGHSMGGALALHLALTAPERVAGLALLGTGASLRVNSKMHQDILDDFESFVETFMSFAYGPLTDKDLADRGAALLREIPPEVFYRGFAACRAFDVRGELGRIACPTAVICGREDRMTPPRLSLFLAEQIPGAELTIIDHAAHMLHLETPALLADALGAFLARYGG